MSGHSKWSKIKHQKGSQDAAKGKIFTKLSNIISIAVRDGGGITDPNSNFKLRLAMEKARSLNMPKEKIERAIERGAGKTKQENFQETIYEAFGPGGVGIVIETASDNKQRTVADLKSTLERGGGSLAISGSVAHFFQLVGLIHVSKNVKSYDTVMSGAIDLGALDLEDTGETIEIYTQPADLHKVKEGLLKLNIPVSSFELFYRSTSTIPVNNPDTVKQLLQLLTSLEDLDDVKSVYANFEIPDEYLK